MIHQTAIVEDGACVGAGTKIWHHSHIRGGAVIGEDCVIGKNVYVDTKADIGDRCKLQNNVCVYQGVSIGDDVFIGPAVTFTNDLMPRAFNSEWVVHPTRVENGASIGANSTIVCGVNLGEFSMIAAGATVTRDVKAHQLVAGTPARHLGWVCRCGTVLSRIESIPNNFVCSSCAERNAL